MCHYHGTVLTGKAAKEYIREKQAAGEDTSYLLEYNDGENTCCIDGREDDGSQGRPINHSRKHPNLKIHQVTIREVYSISCSKR